MDFTAESFNIFDRDWALVAAGTERGWNAMTISWGGLGTLWGKPVATVYVKPVRYTHEFLEKNGLFTVNFFPKEQRKALALMGTVSGRDGDKAARAGLTPVFLEGAVRFREASATLLCKKIYRHDLDPKEIPEEAMRDYYEFEAPHTMYIGQVLEILKNEK